MSEPDAQQQPTPASPYSTGGGGTVLEHRYGAVLLAALLTGDPVPALPSSFTVTEIAFQASHDSRVDDFLIVGRVGGRAATVSIAVRRDPMLIASNDAAVKLIAAFLAVTLENEAEVQAGRWRLALAVASPKTHALELRTLAAIARSQPTESAFREQVSRATATTTAVRNRLAQIDKLVDTAVSRQLVDLHGYSLDEACWRMLSAMLVIELRLEGVDESDRTAAVARLRGVLAEDTAEQADALFNGLLDLSGRYAPTATRVTATMLRRDLQGVARLGPDSRFTRAHELLGSLAERLAARTGLALSDGSSRLELDRHDALQALETAIHITGENGQTLVVRGEPDVGKSALTVRCIRSRRDASASVTALSLADLPARTLEVEALLGGPLAEVLGAAAISGERLLVVDGAEAVLEGRRELLSDLATAALSAGSGVVAVTRSDAAEAVADALRIACAAALPGTADPAPSEHEVPPLADPEAQQIMGSFPSLLRLEHEPRARWLLRRPGLIDLLLRADATTALPDGAISEADVFAVIWHQLVRRGETTPPGGASPDARANALVALARQHLLQSGADTGTPDPSALPSLRSDGLLLSAGATSAWDPHDQFANDLVRDLALARLLLTDGFMILSNGGAPRWGLRAARLACQAALAREEQGTEQVRGELQAVFDALALEHGERWAELPLEAMLTLGAAKDSLERCWPALEADDGALLGRLLRIALQRHTHAGVGDPGVLGPLVEMLCEHPERLAGRHGPRGDLASQAREVVLAWLLGVSAVEHALPVRARLRDIVLDQHDNTEEEFGVNVLALLGTDLDTTAVTFLRTRARENPWALEPAVEALGCAPTLARHNPKLLVELADGYYIDRDRRGGGQPFREGVRHHTYSGIGTRSAGWWRGPFWCLLRVDPAEALAVINRLLDHAAGEQARGRDPFGLSPARQEPVGIELDIAGESRFCVGDARAWSWYRGSSVGPEVCTSALLAVERFADERIAAGEPIATVVERVLADCHNLAMSGLVIGLLERHIANVSDELDLWIARPEIWELEFSRATYEGVLHVQGPDPSDTVGRELRKLNMSNAATLLVMKALTEDDRDRLARLKQIGRELPARAADVFSDEDPANAATVTGWASQLDSENYTLTHRPDGQVTIGFDPPQDVTEQLSDTHADFHRGGEAWRLLNTYSSGRNGSDPGQLERDLAIARELAADPPTRGPSDPMGAPAAVTAAALVAHSEGRLTLDAEQGSWAARFLLDRARPAARRQHGDDFGVYPMGVDRSAAAGLPSLLLPTAAPADIDTGALNAGLIACAEAPPDEVRRILADALRPVWSAPCNSQGACRHQIALEIVEAFLNDCVLGPWDEQGQGRPPQPLSGPAVRALEEVPTDALLTNRLAAAIVASTDAAASTACVAAAAAELRGALRDAYCRGAIHWADKGYGGNLEDHHRVPNRMVFAAAAAGDRTELERCIRAFAASQALPQLLDDISSICTYDPDLRRALPDLWPWLMGVALEEIENTDYSQASHRAYEDLSSSLIPHPSIDMADKDPKTTIQAARSTWIQPELLAGHVPRWMRIARGEPHAVDSLISLVEVAPEAWQATTGLEWLDGLIDGKYLAIASRCFYLPRFLEELRSSELLDSTARARLQRMIDGLVAAGDSRAIGTQRAEE